MLTTGLSLIYEYGDTFKKDFHKTYVEYQKELMETVNGKWDIPSKEEWFKDTKNPGYHSCLILENEKIIGLVCFQDIFFEKPKMFYIDQFYIKPEFRRKGYGKKTLSLLKDIYIGKNTTCWLYVLKKNKRGYNFWTKVIPENSFKYIQDARCVIEENEIPDAIKLIFKRK